MAEEIEELYRAIVRDLCAGVNVDFQELSASTRYSLVRRAAHVGVSWVMESLLDGGCPINAGKTDHDSPLHLAVRRHHEFDDMAKLLLERGADVNSKNENGETPLLIAVEKRNSKILDPLLNYGADVNVDLFNAIRVGNLQQTTALIDSQGASSGLLGEYAPLRLAVYMNHVDIVRILLDRGYRVNASVIKHKSPLHLAVINGNCEMVEMLLKKGADVNIKSKNCKTPLFRAVELSHFPIVELLIKYGADVNTEDHWGKTPLYFYDYKHSSTVESEAVMLEIAKLLLNKGANVNATCEYYGTPLRMSIRKGLYSLTDLLLMSDADVNLVGMYSDNQTTPLQLAAEDGAREIACSLLAKGADVNAKSEDGRTALEMAVGKNHEEVAELLLANGATVNCVDSLGNSLFHRFAISWWYQFTETTGTLLLKLGADVNRKTEIGRTALHIAAKEGKPELVDFLLENGAQVNCKDKEGEAPLHMASTSKIIDILMEFGATVDYRSKDGRTPLHRMSSSDRSREVAMSSLGRHCAIATLLEYGADINIKCNRGLTPLDWTHQSIEGHLLDEEDRYDAIERNASRDVLLRHQAKMESVGLYVEESQFSARYEGRIEEFRKSCQEGVLFLRSEFISGTSVSYYDFVRRDVRFLARYMNNENMVQVAESEEYRSKFPTYASMIKSQFRRGKARNHLLKSANQVLNQLIDLPDYCTEKIMDYLCDDDLSVLIDVRDLVTDYRAELDQ